jgi:hypothetical protein
MCFHKTLIYQCVNFSDGRVIFLAQIDVANDL